MSKMSETAEMENLDEIGEIPTNLYKRRRTFGNPREFAKLELALELAEPTDLPVKQLETENEKKNNNMATTGGHECKDNPPSEPPTRRSSRAKKTVQKYNPVSLIII